MVKTVPMERTGKQRKPQATQVDTVAVKLPAKLAHLGHPAQLAPLVQKVHLVQKELPEGPPLMENVENAVKLAPKVHLVDPETQVQRVLSAMLVQSIPWKDPQAHQVLPARKVPKVSQVLLVKMENPVKAAVEVEKAKMATLDHLEKLGHLAVQGARAALVPLVLANTVRHQERLPAIRHVFSLLFIFKTSNCLILSSHLLHK